MPAPADYARIKALFNAVCDLPDVQGQRQALAARGADEATIAIVLALLQHDRSEAPLAPRWQRLLVLLRRGR